MPHAKTWNDRWVCIGGGTSGFGLVMAKEFAVRGAKVAILGRDAARGEKAVAELQSVSRSEIRFFSVDLTDQDIVDRSDWAKWLPSIELSAAIAATGQSDRGYIEAITLQELEQLWKTNVVSALLFSQTVLPSLKKSAGTLVHIASLAGLLAKPGMGSYAIVKHALVAMSRQLRIEMKPHHVPILLVCPGPIRRDQDGPRYDAIIDAKQLPDELRQPAGGAKLKVIDSTWLAQRIIRGVESGEQEIVVPKKAQCLSGLGNLFPSLFDRFLR
jgi:uncharacterized protein